MQNPLFMIVSILLAVVACDRRPTDHALAPAEASHRPPVQVSVRAAPADELDALSAELARIRREQEEARATLAADRARLRAATGALRACRSAPAGTGHAP